MILRYFKKLRNRLTHKHDYEVIFRFKYSPSRNKDCDGNDIWVPGTLERCYCGKERARAFFATRTEHINPLWIRETYAEAEFNQVDYEAED